MLEAMRPCGAGLQCSQDRLGWERRASIEQKPETLHQPCEPVRAKEKAVA